MRPKIAHKVVELILDDLNGRSGYDDIWDNLSIEIQDDIYNAWVEILLEEVE